MPPRRAFHVSTLGSFISISVKRVPPKRSFCSIVPLGGGLFISASGKRSFLFLPLGRGLFVWLCLWEEVFLFLSLGRGFYFSQFAGKRASEEGFSHFDSRECITDHGEMCASE